jgi:hypothetical protein
VVWPDQCLDGISREIRTPVSPAALWLSLVFPSAFIVHKYLGWAGLIAYALCAALALAVVPRLIARIPGDRLAGAAWITFAVLAVVFVLAYPKVDTRTPGRGSDDADAYDVGVHALLAGESPYRHTTYLGNPLHQLPGAFVLAAPFVLMGTSALQNLFWLALLYVAIKRETNSERTTLQLAWLVLGFSPIVVQHVIVGMGYLANTIYVLLGLWWLMRTARRDLAAIAWGVALASRANFLFLVPLAAGWLYRSGGWRVALRAVALSCATVALLACPFYLRNPANFGPLEAANRLSRFDALIPHLGAALVAAMGVLAVGLSFLRTRISGVLRSCAIVQAFPVVAGTVLGSVQNGTADLGYAPYGVFFACFVLVGLAVEPSAGRGTLSGGTLSAGGSRCFAIAFTS